MSTSCPSFHLLFRVIDLTNEILFMCSCLVWSLLDVLYDTTSIIHGGWSTALLILEFVPQFTLTPRFILSLRALYARNVQGGQGSDIDTAFGFTSAPGHGTVGTIVFADAEQNEGAEQEEIQMEERAGEIRNAGSSA